MVAEQDPELTSAQQIYTPHLPTESSGIPGTTSSGK